MGSVILSVLYVYLEHLIRPLYMKTLWMIPFITLIELMHPAEVIIPESLAELIAPDLILLLFQIIMVIH